MYQQMYTIVFRILEERYGYTVRWKFLHNDGLLGITIDQDHQNLIGMGSESLPNRYRTNSESIYQVLASIFPLNAILIIVHGIGKLSVVYVSA